MEINNKLWSLGQDNEGNMVEKWEIKEDDPSHLEPIILINDVRARVEFSLGLGHLTVIASPTYWQ